MIAGSRSGPKWSLARWKREIVEAAEELRDIARVLSIEAGADANIRDAMEGILNIADRLERRK